MAKKEEEIMTIDMLKAELLSSSKGTFMSVLGDTKDGEFLESSAMDLNRVLSGTLSKAVKTKTHTGLVGPEACLDENTHISFTSINGDKKDHKGGKIKNLYRRFHKNDGRVFTVSSINENNCIISNRIVDVVKTGKKECYTITTSKGFSITTTKDHKFYIGNGEFLPLEELTIGDEVYIHDNYRNKKEKKKIFKYKEIMVKYHPNGRKRIVNNCVYYRIKRCNFVYEANLNGMTFDGYRNYLNKESIENINKLKIVDTTNNEIHHIDENTQNDEISNLKLMDRHEHLKYHADKNQNNLRFVSLPDIIVSKEFVGERETYDIKCLSPYNSYTANKFIVHNSGKSSIMCLMLADAQKKGYLPVVIDAEGAWTSEFVSRWGMDPTNIIRIQSMWVDEIQVELGRWIDKGFKKLAIAVDSIGALELRKMINDSIKGDVKADQGRLQKEIKRMLKMLVSIAKFQESVIFSAGHYYGNPTGYGEPEKIGGGNYYRLSCDNIITLKKTPIYENPGAATKAAKGKIIGNSIKAATLKNRDYPPFQEASIEIDYKNGVNEFAGIIPLCLNMGLVEKHGSWYSCDILELKEQGEIKLEKAMKSVDCKPLLEAIEKVLETTGYSTVNEELELSIEKEED